MEKNWLIRTKSNHILGPVSKEKVLELYQNGTIKLDDEVCSGNGYWFYIRESELVEKYLLGRDIQSFNPISEAKDVLTSGAQQSSSMAPNDDITLIGNINLNQLHEDKAEKPATTPSPAAAPAPVTPAAPVLPKATINEPIKEVKPPVSSIPQPKKEIPKVQAKAAPGIKKKKKVKQQNYLKYLGYLLLIILVLLIYYRISVKNSFFSQNILNQPSLDFVSTVHAQEESPEKKKSF